MKRTIISALICALIVAMSVFGLLMYFSNDLEQSVGYGVICFIILGLLFLTIHTVDISIKIKRN